MVSIQGGCGLQQFTVCLRPFLNEIQKINVLLEENRTGNTRSIHIRYCTCTSHRSRTMSVTWHLIYFMWIRLLLEVVLPDESALDLADEGYRVTLVEKNPSIGGKLIGLANFFHARLLQPYYHSKIRCCSPREH